MPFAEIPFFSSTVSEPVAILAAAGIGLYVAARFGTHAVLGPGGLTGARGGRLALAQWAPTVLVAMTALFSGRPDLALSVTFAASVAALSLAFGMIVFMVPDQPAAATRRAWPFLLPAALLPLLAGFGGALNLIHAAMMLAVGAAVWFVWKAAERETSASDLGGVLECAAASSAAGSSATEPPLAAPAEPAAPKNAEMETVLRVSQGILACGVMVLAAWRIVSGTLAVDAGMVEARANLIAVAVLGPLLALPLLSTGADMAQRNRAGEACSACVGVALLNMLLLVPLLVGAYWGQLIWHGRAWPAAKLKEAIEPGFYGTLSSRFGQLPSLHLPLTTWRIDVVFLVILGFAMLPIAVGRWRTGRLEALLLVIGYGAYLAATAFALVSGG